MARKESTPLHETSPVLIGGDLDADWMRSEGAGEETMGGTQAGQDLGRDPSRTHAAPSLASLLQGLAPRRLNAPVASSLDGSIVKVLR
jgi:hypothetical protein